MTDGRGAYTPDRIKASINRLEDSEYYSRLLPPRALHDDLMLVVYGSSDTFAGTVPVDEAVIVASSAMRLDNELGGVTTGRQNG